MQGRFNLKPKRLAADRAYGTGKFLGWLVKKKKITPHIPVWEKSDRQDGIFSRSDFRWDGKRGAYICPKGWLQVCGHASQYGMAARRQSTLLPH